MREASRTNKDDAQTGPVARLYYMAESPPCRAVLMTAAHLNVPLELNSLDLSRGEQLSATFCQVNPLHTLPTLVESDFTLWESRAIMIYLVNRYKPESDLYPSEPKKRAKVDQLLYFDIGTLYSSQTKFLGPILSCKEPDGEGESKFHQSLRYLDMQLSETEYVALDHPTLADLSILAGLSFAEACQFDFSKYQRIHKWMERLKGELSYYRDINQEPMERFRQYMLSKREAVKRVTS